MDNGKRWEMCNLQIKKALKSFVEHLELFHNSLEIIFTKP